MSMALAGSLQSSSGPLRSFAQRFLHQIRSPNSLPAGFAENKQLITRGVQTSVYDKNIDDQVQATVVPDEVIQPQSDKYWAPDPQTGVFGPATEVNPGSDAEPFFHSSAGNANNASEDSVLEQKAFFRPLENVEKPPPEDLELPEKSK